MNLITTKSTSKLVIQPSFRAASQKKNTQKQKQTCKHLKKSENKRPADINI